MSKEKKEYLEVLGTNGVKMNLRISAFKGMSKTKFDKKYGGRIVDLDKNWESLQAELKGGSKKNEAANS